MPLGALLQLLSGHRGPLPLECSGLGRSSVDLPAHERFGVEPTAFAQFARRNAAIFRGATDYAITPA